MPIFEYACGACKKEFEELVFGEQTPACPHCGSDKVVKLMSASAIKTEGNDMPGLGAMPPMGGCGGGGG